MARSPFDAASGLQNVPCPQNLLSNFSGPGLYSATGRTTHPNSEFMPVAQVPEDLTTVTVAGQQPGGWIRSSSADVTLSSQPPALAGTNLAGEQPSLRHPSRASRTASRRRIKCPYPQRLHRLIPWLQTAFRVRLRRIRLTRQLPSSRRTRRL